MRSTVKRGPRTKLVKQTHMRAEMQRMAECFIKSRARSSEQALPWGSYLPPLTDPFPDSKTEFDGFI